MGEIRDNSRETRERPTTNPYPSGKKCGGLGFDLILFSGNRQIPGLASLDLASRPVPGLATGARHEVTD